MFAHFGIIVGLCASNMLPIVAHSETYPPLGAQKIQTYHGTFIMSFEVVVDTEWFDPALGIYIPPDLINQFGPSSFTLRLASANQPSSPSERFRNITSNQSL